MKTGPDKGMLTNGDDSAVTREALGELGIGCTNEGNLNLIVPCLQRASTSSGNSS